MAADIKRRSRKTYAPWPNERPASKLPLWLIFVAVIVLAGSFALDRYLAPADAQVFDAISPSGQSVRINEVMSSNRSAITDDRGRYSDWIEVINTSVSPVDVSGWTVLDGESRLVGFTFPSQVLAPGEIVLIYASGTLKNVAGYPYHAPFKLAANGDSVVLRNADGALVDQLTVPALMGNQSYARNEQTGQWAPTMYYTPGLPNVSANHQTLLTTVGSASGVLVINELMPANAGYRLSGEGTFDYIELYNQGSTAIDLNGYMLSDDESRPGKWTLDSRVIAPGEALLIHASGLTGGDASTAGEIHAPFRLSSKGETVVLSDPSGRLIDRVSCPEMNRDRAYSRMAGEAFTADYPPTPGQLNNAMGLAATERALVDANPVGVTLNEAIASARKQNANKSSPDWVELYNATDAAIDLSGYGLSDDSSQPRKWRFPSGTKIGAGGYLVVQLTGADKSNPGKNTYSTSFKLSYTSGETLTLATPDGAIIDRLPMIDQRSAVSYGRMPGRNGYYYMDTPTPDAENSGAAYTAPADPVAFSTPGGWYTGGVTVELSAGSGQLIRYTLDASEPTEQSSVYSGPIAISSNTIVRARSYGDSLLPSLTYTQTYLFGEKHTLPVVSLVTDPRYLNDEKIGIYTVGPKQLKYPYKGANFWKNWERAGNVELFGVNGNTVVSQGIGVALQGQYSRMEKQKAFKLTARNAYGAPRINAALFPNRPYESYRSFILRSSGQDTDKTRLRDAVLVTLAEDTSVMYQDAAPVVVYLNGEYWGHYNMRERIHKYSIGQYENWENLDAIDIVKGNSGVKQGTNTDYAEFLKWLKKNGCTTPETLARVEEMVDIDNYLDYVAVEMYIGNTDLLNVKRYRSSEGDGRWRWILYDTDWAFYTDTDSYRRWLDKDGAGSGKKTDNTLFVQLMKNPEIKQKFLTRFGELMFKSWRSEIVVGKIDAYAALIEPEMERQFAKWGKSVKAWNNSLGKFKAYAKERPKKMLGYISKELGFTNTQMRVYFGDIMDSLGI